MRGAIENEAAVVRRIVGWAERQAIVRAVVLTSARARPGAPVDALSDYDVVLYVSETGPLLEDGGWTRELGPVLVEMPQPGQEHLWRFPTRLVLYEDGTKVDFTILPADALRQAARGGRLPEELDAGYRALLDRDGLAAALPAPSGAAYLPRPPSQAEFTALVGEFWWETTYVAKSLWRGELLPARYSLECVIRLDLLRRMLEWRVELDHGWTLRPGPLGRGLRAHLAPGRWRELEQTFAGVEIEDNWRALSRTIALFRTVATEVAGHLGLEYPHRLDERVSRYLEAIRAMEPPGGGSA